ERLVDRLELMQRLRGKPGSAVTAIVKPDCRQWKTKFGTKLRPEFTILDWREIGAAKEQPTQLPAPQQAAANEAPQATTADEDPPWDLDDLLPRSAKPQTPAGKPVKPLTREEEFNDSLEDIYRNFPT